jgi:hypothetical protein
VKEYSSDHILNELLNEYVRLGGSENYYLYRSRPGDGQDRFVFQDVVIRGRYNAHDHIRQKIAEMTP